MRIKIMDMLGTPIEKGFQLLPDSVEKGISTTCNIAISKAADFALFSMRNASPQESSDWFHRVSVWATGAAGGFGGIPGTLIEIPVSTTIMLRSIFDIARSEGENIFDNDTRLAALQVFAFGGHAKSDDTANTAYYATRMAMAYEVKQAYEFLAKGAGKLVDKNAPALIQLIQKIATRFSIPVTEKAVAQAMPFVSAVIGLTINDIFIAHFQDVARGHFTVRRLERKYGKELVQQIYESFNNKNQ
jgi:hypothetical protein